MLNFLKKIFGSRWFKFVFSAVLIYFAFKKVNVVELFYEIKRIPVWFVLVSVIWSFLLVALISFRWSLLLFSKIKIKTILTFTRASFLAAFYSLFFPTAVAGEVSKWIVVDQKYPEIPKTKVLGSIVLDRFIGFSVFIALGLVTTIIGKKAGLMVPNYVFYLLIILTIVCFLIYTVIYFFDVSKILPKAKFLNKLDDAFDLLKDKNKSQIIKCFLISIVSETLWILQIWFVGQQFGTKVEILSVFVFIPVISMILILPISIGGFGAREQLYLLFFLQAGGTTESILLMSTFLGILGIFNALFGGVLLFFDQEIKKKIVYRT